MCADVEVDIQFQEGDTTGSYSLYVCVYIHKDIYIYIYIYACVCVCVDHSWRALTTLTGGGQDGELYTYLYIYIYIRTEWTTLAGGGQDGELRESGRGGLWRHCCQKLHLSLHGTHRERERERERESERERHRERKRASETLLATLLPKAPSLAPRYMTFLFVFTLVTVPRRSLSLKLSDTRRTRTYPKLVTQNPEFWTLSPDPYLQSANGSHPPLQRWVSSARTTTPT